MYSLAVSLSDTVGLNLPAFTFALALAAGMIANALAHHLRLPGIVLFLAAGVMLGPEFLNVVRPETLGSGLDTIVALAVAVILFEGGLNLNVSRLKSQATIIRRLVTIGAIVTAIGGTLAALWVMGWPLYLSVIFGTLVIVTGPTVVSPLVRRIRLTPRLQTILEAEGVLIDPIGAVIAVVTLELVLDQSSGSAAALGVLGLPTRLLVGAAVGALGGFLIGFVLGREHVVPEEHRNMFTLALVLALFAASEAIIAESGIMAAPVAGIVVGNMRTRVREELLEFKEQLTTLLVGMLFVILAADVSVSEVTGLGIGGVVTIALLMFVVRPLDVAVCTYKSDLALKEKAFIAWIGPRGIVAAAVASLFAQRLTANGMEGGPQLQALVFAVIAATVVLQGLSGAPIAAALGLRRTKDQGFAIVGANGVGLALAGVLRDSGHPVVIVDSNAVLSAAAKESGFDVVYGNAANPSVMYRADLEGRRGFVVTTMNDGANLLIANRARDETREVPTFVTITRDSSAVTEEQVSDDGHRLLFGRGVDLAQWDHMLRSSATKISRWIYQPKENKESWKELVGGQRRADALFLPLAVAQKGRVAPLDDRTNINPGDVVVVVMPEKQSASVSDRLLEIGLLPVE